MDVYLTLLSCIVHVYYGPWIYMWIIHGLIHVYYSWTYTCVLFMDFYMCIIHGLIQGVSKKGGRNGKKGCVTVKLIIDSTSLHNLTKSFVSPILVTCII